MSRQGIRLKWARYIKSIEGWRCKRTMVYILRLDKAEALSELGMPKKVMNTTKQEKGNKPFCRVDKNTSGHTPNYIYACVFFICPLSLCYIMYLF